MITFRLDVISWLFGAMAFAVSYITYIILFPVIENIIAQPTAADPLIQPFLNQVRFFWNNAIIVLAALAILFIILSSIRFEQEKYYV
jgi:hypothetical protein